MQTCHVEFRIQLREDWIPVRALATHLDELLHYYLSQPHLSCCDMQAGFFIHAGSAPWNGPDTVDEFRNAVTWLDALAAILSDEADVADVWAWEESSARLQRHGNLLELSDTHHSGQIVCPTITVDLMDFSNQLYEEALSWASLADAATLALATPTYQDYAAELKLVLLENLLPSGLHASLSKLKTALKL